MIASEDVRRVTFERAMRGYRCEDVDDYLKQVADSIDALTAEQEELQKKILVLAQRIDQYRADEDTLRTTMLNAQRLGDNVVKEAKQKAAEIIHAATVKAEETEQQANKEAETVMQQANEAAAEREKRAREEVETARQDLVTVKKEADAFKKLLMEMYRKHIELLTKLPSYAEEEAEHQAQAAQAQAQPEPAPEPAPEPVPEEEPAAAPAEVEEEYEQQQFETDEPAEEAEPVEEEPEEPEEDDDTLEFPQMAGDETFYVGETDPEPEEDELEERFVPGAGLYDLPAEEPVSPRKRGGRRRTTDDVPEGLESFAGVDFDS